MQIIKSKESHSRCLKLIPKLPLFENHLNNNFSTTFNFVSINTTLIAFTSTSYSNSILFDLNSKPLSRTINSSRLEFTLPLPPLRSTTNPRRREERRKKRNRIESNRRRKRGGIDLKARNKEVWWRKVEVVGAISRLGDQTAWNVGGSSLVSTWMAHSESSIRMEGSVTRVISGQ